MFKAAELLSSVTAVRILLSIHISKQAISQDLDSPFKNVLSSYNMLGNPMRQWLFITLLNS